MTRTWTVLFAAALMGCAAKSEPGAQTSGTAQWDDAAAKEADAAVRRGVNAFTVGNVDSLKAVLAADGNIPSFELDLDGKPVRLTTRDDQIKFGQDVVAQLNQMKATVKVDVRSLDCRAASGLAYCAMEHDVKATMPDGKVISQPSRASIVLHKGANGWQWVHWHTSLREAPPPPPTPAAGKKG